MKRFIVICLTLLLVLSATAIGVSAMSPADAEEDVPAVSDTPKNEVLPENSGTSPSESNNETMPEDTPVLPPTESLPDESTPDKTTETPSRSFGEIVNYIWDHYAGEIFSALSLVASLILAYFYKKGLMPVVWNGLDRITKTGAKTEEKIDSFFTRIEPVLSEVNHATSVADNLGAYVKGLEKRLDESENDRARMEIMMAGVTEMLYGVFSAANLPAYAKEQLGERYNALMACIKEAKQTDEIEEAPHI